MDHRRLSEPAGRTLGFLGFSGYQWLVIAAAWAGWGFDIFDAMLFNFVAPNCVPGCCLHLQPDRPRLMRQRYSGRRDHLNAARRLGCRRQCCSAGWRTGSAASGRCLRLSLVYAAGTGFARS